MMKINRIKAISKGIFVLFLLSSLIVPCTFSAESTDPSSSMNDYIDITVEEAWDFLSDTSNGIQLPIDVRTDSEWTTERIDTPFPEFPRHFKLSDISDEEGYQEFQELYDGTDIIVYCKSGGRSASASSIIVNEGFNGTVYNMLGGITSWKSNYPTKTGNSEPLIPNTPEGPTSCIVGLLYDFTTQTIDPDDDPLRYGWDFNNDETVDIWTDYFPSESMATMQYTFVSTGIYDVSVVAEDIVGSQTDFSSTLTVQVKTNTPPTIPNIEGPNQGEVGTSYDYDVVSTDEDGDEISYFIEWGDGTTEGWTRTLPSGEVLTLSHTWNEKSSYELKVKAKDEYDAESDYAIIEVEMPKTHNYPLFSHLIENHPLLQQIFSYFF